MSEMTQDVRQEAERGLLLTILAEWKMEWIPFHEVRLQMENRTGRRLADDEIHFHLRYLTDRGYAESKRLRAGRAELELTAVRATAKGVDLKAGRIEADVGVGL